MALITSGCALQLVAMRSLQGFSVGGQLVGSMLFSVEVRDPTAWTTTRHDGPNHLGL